MFFLSYHWHPWVCRAHNKNCGPLPVNSLIPRLGCHSNRSLTLTKQLQNHSRIGMRLPRGITATVPKGMATKHFQRAALAAPRLLLRNGTFQFHGSETFPRYSTTAQPTARHQIKPILPLQAQNTCASASLPACSSETGLSHFQVKYKNPA